MAAETTGSQMDPLYQALSYYRRRKFEKCAETCTQILQNNPYDQTTWTLKMRALTSQVWVDDLEADDEGIAEFVMDDNAIATVARPGTSLKTAQTGTSQAFRPMTAGGRPLSGVVRPATHGRPGSSIEGALRTPRTARTARPASSRSGRYVRQGTASMLSGEDGEFINTGRLNLAKYSKIPGVAKALFEYLYYHESDMRKSLDLAAEGTQASNFQDWWWKMNLGKCYYRLGLFRDAEQQFKSAIKQADKASILPYLYSAKVYVRLDQPLAALEVYNQGLEKFPAQVAFLTGIARVHEGLNDLAKAVKFYKDVLITDATDVESIACIATHHFYNDQPEVALRFYRRLLQMGVYNAELFCNVGLCCFYAQQYDMALQCMQHALRLASDDALADVWYNISHIALGVGDTHLCYQCLRLCIVYEPEHAEAYNNLGVLEMRRGYTEQARAFFLTATNLGEHLFESHYNYSYLAEKMGDLQSSYILVQKALSTFPEHMDSKRLLERLRKQFTQL